jgi:hypothetical protein
LNECAEPYGLLLQEALQVARSPQEKEVEQENGNALLQDTFKRALASGNLRKLCTPLRVAEVERKLTTTKVIRDYLEQIERRQRYREITQAEIEASRSFKGRPVQKKEKEHLCNSNDLIVNVMLDRKPTNGAEILILMNLLCSENDFKHICDSNTFHDAHETSLLGRHVLPTHTVFRDGSGDLRHSEEMIIQVLMSEIERLAKFVKAQVHEISGTSSPVDRAALFKNKAFLQKVLIEGRRGTSNPAAEFKNYSDKLCARLLNVAGPSPLDVKQTDVVLEHDAACQTGVSSLKNTAFAYSTALDKQYKLYLESAESSQNRMAALKNFLDAVRKRKDSVQQVWTCTSALRLGTWDETNPGKPVLKIPANPEESRDRPVLSKLTEVYRELQASWLEVAPDLKALCEAACLKEWGAKGGEFQTVLGLGGAEGDGIRDAIFEAIVECSESMGRMHTKLEEVSERLNANEIGHFLKQKWNEGEERPKPRASQVPQRSSRTRRNA